MSANRAAVYRMLYGAEYILDSIDSVHDAVDYIYVFYTNRVWGNCTEVIYKGETVKFPHQFDNAVELIEERNSQKIRLVEDYYPTPHNQYTYLVNNFVLGDTVLLIEPDQVIPDAEKAFREFESRDDKVAAMRQIEFWKTKEYRIPERPRPGPIFWRPPLPETLPNGAPKNNIPRLDSIAHNYGFCVSDSVMYWKHLTALAFSPVIGDSRPRPDWYEEVWLKWTPEMENLEISMGHEKAIPHAIKIG